MGLARGKIIDEIAISAMVSDEVLARAGINSDYFLCRASDDFCNIAIESFAATTFDLFFGLHAFIVAMNVVTSKL